MSEYVHRIDNDESARITRFLRLLAIGTVGFVLLVVFLIWTANYWLRIVSLESERRFIEPYIEWSRGRLISEGDPALQAYVESLTSEIESLLGVEDEPRVVVQVIEGTTVNAFATLGGYIFVYEGLIDTLDSENALAMVLAHEIAHVHHRDPLTSTGRAMLIQLAISTLSGSGIDPNSIDTGTDLMLNQYSRSMEIAADELALELLHKKYGHVGEAKRLFEIIRADTEASDLAEFLSTHPDTSDRIENIDRWAETAGWHVEDALPYPEDVNLALGRN